MKKSLILLFALAISGCIKKPYTEYDYKAQIKVGGVVIVEDHVTLRDAVQVKQAIDSRTIQAASGVFFYCPPDNKLIIISPSRQQLVQTGQVCEFTHSVK